MKKSTNGTTMNHGTSSKQQTFSNVNCCHIHRSRAMVVDGPSGIVVADAGSSAGFFEHRSKWDSLWQKWRRSAEPQ